MSANLEHQCLAKGVIGVTCSAKKGDSPEFNLTLDGKKLNLTQTLTQNTAGLLKCSVRNHVSEDHKELNITPSFCGKF